MGGSGVVGGWDAEQRIGVERVGLLGEVAEVL